MSFADKLTVPTPHLVAGVVDVTVGLLTVIATVFDGDEPIGVTPHNMCNLKSVLLIMEVLYMYCWLHLQYYKYLHL
jgi:hypothetical protein